DMEERLRAEKAEAAAREARAHAEALEAERKLAAQRAAFQLEDKRALEEAAALARDARARADALIQEKKKAADVMAWELEQKKTLERAEAAALDAERRAESLAANARLVAERDSREFAERASREGAAALEREARLRSQMEGLKEEARKTAKASTAGSGWSWPWSSSTTTKTTHTHSQEGYDSSDHLLEHIVEDIRQTKEDLEDGFDHLKDAVLGAEAKVADAAGKVRETVREAVEEVTPKRSSWWSSGSSTSTTESTPKKATTTIGRNVEAVALKAEKDVEERARALGKEMSETARKAYDNVIDAATNVQGQYAHGHPHAKHDHSSHSHSHSNSDGHHLMDHIVEDIRQTKDDIQHGVENLKDAVFGAEKETSAKVEEVKEEGRRWWSAKTHEAEKQASRLDSELRAGLDRAGSKLREMGNGIDEKLAGREANDNDYWFQVEQNRQQQERRGGRGL
ncbi:hypothetical protein BGZ94_001041, partial [Podila epigama]